MVKLVSQQELDDRTHTVFMTMPSATSGYESRIQFNKNCIIERSITFFIISQNVYLNNVVLSTIIREKILVTQLCIIYFIN